MPTKQSRNGSRKVSKKRSRKVSKKGSRKISKKMSREISKKMSRKISKKGSRKNPCGVGKILKDGYYRKAYRIKSYIKSDGTKVNGTSVKSAFVAPTCIQDKGKIGKGPKLFQIKKNGMMRKYGYSTSGLMKSRRLSIDKAIKNNEKHEVLKHLVAIRTLNKSNKDLYDVLDKDVKYIQGKYFK
jgi:hypothetical protein